MFVHVQLKFFVDPETDMKTLVSPKYLKEQFAWLDAFPGYTDPEIRAWWRKVSTVGRARGDGGGG